MADTIVLFHPYIVFYETYNYKLIIIIILLDYNKR